MEKARINEVRIVQNPCLAAVLLWRFCFGYTQASSKAVPLPLIFVVLPILFQRNLRQHISSTRHSSGLSKVIEKLAQANEAKIDLLEGINSRSIEMRPLTLDALRILLRTKLVDVQPNGGIVASERKPDFVVNHDVQKMIGAAEKLGLWLSTLSLYQSALLLRVRF